MIANFTREQRKQIIGGDREVAARRLHELLRASDGRQNMPSIEACVEIVDLLVAGIEQTEK